MIFVLGLLKKITGKSSVVSTFAEEAIFVFIVKRTCLHSIGGYLSNFVMWIPLKKVGIWEGAGYV